mgnify:FL=1
MMRAIETTGKTVDEAVQAALSSLKLERKDVDIEVISEGSKGLFGLFGAKVAKVKVTAKEEIKAQPSIEDEWKKILRGEDLEPAKSQVKEPVEVVKEELMSDDTEDVGVDFLKQLIEKMGLRATVTKKVDDDMFMLDVTGRSLGALIGRHGETLDSVQYLVNLVAAKNTRESGSEDRTRYIVDVEGYRKKREQALTDMALKVADKVAVEGKSQVLEPMSALERRIVHTALQNVEGVSTHSEGREPFRRIVITRK